MNRLMPEQRFKIVQIDIENHGSVRTTYRALIPFYGQHNRLSEQESFGNRIVSRFGTVNWPTRSCNLTPLDYFLWRYVKSLVYADKFETIDYLEDNICRFMPDIWPQMLGKVIENWTSRLDYVRTSCGGHMPEVTLKL
ncbi:unnamed protein product [Euphydryas editha]|uniref:DUF2442 domain-containing protein n=1 Tax=Euphydryas editha TaxID=104508 RepID=A0AAU9TK31_EUPED|nr:unnamed protein product [Euphydryas editha]